jgi:hypothetical protein
MAVNCKEDGRRNPGPATFNIQENLVSRFARLVKPTEKIPT